MKRILLAALFIFATDILFAQDRYVVFLSDKNNSPYSVSNPQAFLSARAIARRTAQNIPVTTLDLPVNPSYVTAISGTGAQVLAVSKWFNSVTVRVSNPSVLTAIQNLSFVSGVLNVGRIGAPSVVPPKIDYSLIRSEVSASQRVSGTGSLFNYGTSFDQVHQMKGDMMHDNGYTGAGIHIAVLDAGFDNSNQMATLDSLFNSGRVLSTWDFVDSETNVFNDGNFHGSMVLSCMAGYKPGELIGTAPGASYHLLRSEYAPSEFLIEEYNWSSAAEYADSAGADIINSSLGYTLFDDPAHNHSYQDLDGNTTPIAIAADIAASRGMIVCNSAGNEGNSSWFRISTPADADSILGVGAVDNLGVIAGFSGRGPSFDGRVKPDVAAMGQGTIVGDPWGLTGTFPGNGTSFASPLMAGMVATLWQCHPNATNMQIITAVKQSASQWSAPDSLQGYGIPDFPLACLLLGGIDSGIDANVDQLQLTGPNPFTEALLFSFYSSARQQVEIRLFDIMGRPVYSESQTVNGIAMHNFSITTPLAKGVYVLEVISEKSSFSLKVIKD